MPRNTPAPASDESDDKDKLIAEVCIVVGDDYDLRLSVASYAGGAPTARINRIGTKGKTAEPFVKAMGSLKSPEEVDGLAAALPKLSAALAKAQKAHKGKA
jgi:hypothetical protein